jgi:hypothetical protein
MDGSVHRFRSRPMTRNLIAASFVLCTVALAGCAKDPEPMPSVETLPPGAQQPDRPRDVPYRNSDSPYSTDPRGSAPRSGINSDPNNPNGAPGSTIGPSTIR